MQGIDWSTAFRFFFDPTVGCCCCVPIAGFLTFVAGITHVSRQNALRFEAHLKRIGGAQAFASR